MKLQARKLPSCTPLAFNLIYLIYRIAIRLFRLLIKLGAGQDRVKRSYRHGVVGTFRRRPHPKSAPVTHGMIRRGRSEQRTLRSRGS